MTIDATDTTPPNWRTQLPVLSARQVTLREATVSDLRPVIDLLSLADASRFGIDEPSAPGREGRCMACYRYRKSAGEDARLRVLTSTRYSTRFTTAFTVWLVCLSR